MDYQGALKFLGLNEGASSEDMVRAKNQMISRYQEEEEKLKKVSHAPPTHVASVAPGKKKCRRGPYPARAAGDEF